MAKKTVTINFTITGSYEANPEHYDGETDPKEMLAMDEGCFQDDFGTLIDIISESDDFKLTLALAE